MTRASISDPVFARALAKDPAERFLSARGLVDAVTSVLDAAGLGDLGPPAPAAAALDATTIEPDVPVVRRAPVRRRRRLLPYLAIAALVGAAVALGASSLLAGDDEPTEAVPAPLEGMRVLGSDLSRPGRTLDCRGRAPRPDSTSCAVLQATLPGRTLVVPQDGVVRRWAVRSMRGELSLAVFRPHADGYTQVARSPNEFAENDGVFAFPVDLPVQRGDVVGLVAVEGAGLGVRTGVEGATTNRWLPNIEGNEPPDLGAGTGLDDELLLRVEYLPGGQPRLPQRVGAAAAAKLPGGRVKERRRLRYADGPPVEIDLVELDGRYVIDQFVRGRRTARIDVPGFFPGRGDVITFDAYAEEAGSGLGIYLEYVATNSARVINHFYAAFPTELEFVN